MSGAETIPRKISDYSYFHIRGPLTELGLIADLNILTAEFIVTELV